MFYVFQTPGNVLFLEVSQIARHGYQFKNINTPLIFEKLTFAATLSSEAVIDFPVCSTNSYRALFLFWSKVYGSSNSFVKNNACKHYDSVIIKI